MAETTFKVLLEQAPEDLKVRDALAWQRGAQHGANEMKQHIVERLQQYGLTDVAAVVQLEIDVE